MPAPTAATQPVNTPPAPLSGPDAHAVLYQRAYVPAWREKLASYGVPMPSTPEQEQAMLEASAALRMRYEDARQKTAAAGDPVLAAVRTQLGLPTVEAATAKATHEQAVKRAAATLSFDPELAHAALSLLKASA